MSISPPRGHFRSVLGIIQTAGKFPMKGLTSARHSTLPKRKAKLRLVSMPPVSIAASSVSLSGSGTARRTRLPPSWKATAGELLKNLAHVTEGRRLQFVHTLWSGNVPSAPLNSSLKTILYPGRRAAVQTLSVSSQASVRSVCAKETAAYNAAGNIAKMRLYFFFSNMV